jgi:hypothetical protein
MNSKNIKEFLYNLYLVIKQILTTDPTALKYIRHKCYPQILLEMLFQHEKAYNPEIDTATPTFYNEGYRKRENLIQDITDVDRVILRIMDKLENQILNFTECGSDWSLVKPIKCTIKLIRHYDAFNKSGSYIPTPAWLRHRKAIINIRNKDNNLFLQVYISIFQQRQV